MLELHVWGPAFTLPSVDPQCLAAIAYCKQSLALNEWTILASSNPLLSPDRYLPALRDGQTWVSGYRGIVEYLCQRSPNSALDSILSDYERAESIALTAYIETHVQHIYDLSLFVTQKNFDNVTRPLYSQFLPFPVQYYTPLTLRSAAKERTNDLEIQINYDPPDPPRDDPRASTAEAAARASLGSRLFSIAPEVGGNIKLMAFCETVFRTLRERLGEHKYFFGAAPSSVDCLAVGYLSLLLFPDLPHPFARDCLTKEKRLAAYVHDLRTPFLGPSIAPEDVLTGRGIPDVLPVSKVERGDVPWLTGVALEKLKQTFDLRSYWPKPAFDVEELDDPMLEEQVRKAREMRRVEWWKSFFTVAAGVAAFGTYVVWSGLVAIQIGEDEEEEQVVDEGGMTAESILSGGLGVANMPPPEEGKKEERREDEEEAGEEEVTLVDAEDTVIDDHDEE